MKKSFLKLCLLTCIVLFGVACSNSVKLTGNEFLIEGKLSGVEDGVVITLYRPDDGHIVVDTVKGGRFTFRDEAKSDQDRWDITVRSDGFPGMFLVVWVAPGAKIKIRGTDKLTPLWKVKSSVPYQKEETLFKNNRRDIIAEEARTHVEWKIANAKFVAAASEDERAAYLQIVDSINVILDTLCVKGVYRDILIMEKAAITPIWLRRMGELARVVLNSNGRYNFDAEQTAYLRKKGEGLYSRMSEEDRNSDIGNYITAVFFPTFPSGVGVGDYFADVDLLDTDGNIKRTADYLGKYILLDFWNRGCQPCIRAMPEMREISETYSNKLTIISISLDTETDWKKSMLEHDMPWVNLRDPKAWGGLAIAYSVSSIPNYVLISPEGTIVDKWAGYGTGYLKQKVGENIEL